MLVLGLRSIQLDITISQAALRLLLCGMPMLGDMLQYHMAEQCKDVTSYTK